MRFGSFKLRGLLMLACVWAHTCHSDIYLNTSNAGKLDEYKSYFFPEPVISQKMDLAEPKADLLTIIQYKASQFDDNVIVDDVSLDVEGLDIGVNVRWFIPELNSPIYFNRRCVFTCMLGIKSNGFIQVYLGSVEGTLVPPRGDGFGFGPYFLPDGASLTLGQDMNPLYNARYLAVQQFKDKTPYKILPVMKVWNGEFQHEE